MHETSGSAGSAVRGLARCGLSVVTRMLAPRYRARRPGKPVAIVVPLSLRSELLPEEEVSLRHLCHFLGTYDKYFVAPAGMSFVRDGFETLHVPRKFFGSGAAHNRLLIWPPFYRAFDDYEYILIYHLDSLVFSDELLRWCREGWDYIGAPWVPCEDTPWVREARVGNGGFTLMRVQSVLQVLHARYRQRPETYWADLVTRNGTRLRPLFRLLQSLRRLFPGARLIERSLRHWETSQHPAGANNDFFWSFEAVHYLPGFRVATVEQGLRFAFEAAPRRCFELAQHQLPFGCHAWPKYDRDFWAPHLLPGDI